MLLLFFFSLKWNGIHCRSLTNRVDLSNSPHYFENPSWLNWHLILPVISQHKYYIHHHHHFLEVYLKNIFFHKNNILSTRLGLSRSENKMCPQRHEHSFLQALTIIPCFFLCFSEQETPSPFGTRREKTRVNGHWRRTGWQNSSDLTSSKWHWLRLWPQPGDELSTPSDLISILSVIPRSSSQCNVLLNVLLPLIRSDDTDPSSVPSSWVAPYTQSCPHGGLVLHPGSSYTSSCSVPLCHLPLAGLPSRLHLRHVDAASGVCCE